MAGDWIRMRCGLRHDAKVVAMARFLSQQREFMNWWTGPLQQPCDVTVTEVVTFQNITRVTVAGLLDIWASANLAVNGTDCVPFMSLSDVDDVTEIPCFGEAMESVGWITQCEGNGLLFSNFREHNIPDKDRKQPDSGAERTRRYREKRQNVTKSDARDACDAEKRREEKSKEEDISPPVPPRPKPKYSAAFREFLTAYPRKDAKHAAWKAWGKLGLDGGEAGLIPRIMASVAEHSESNQWRDRQFIPQPSTFLNGRRWEDEVVRSLDPRSQPGYVDLGL